jgi:twitching motility protein PilT
MIENYLTFLKESKSSTLYFTPNYPPATREDFDIYYLKSSKLTAEDIKNIIQSVLTDAEQERLSNTRSITVGKNINGSLCRLKIFDTLNGYSIILRLWTEHIPSLKELRMPRIIDQIFEHQKGLVLIGSSYFTGKSTTMKALLQHINEHDRKHILTIEESISSVIVPNQCLIMQREVDGDSERITKALEDAGQQEADVIGIDLGRYDASYLFQALKLADSGKLVFYTISGSSSYKILRNILESLNDTKKLQMHHMLSESLAGIVCQSLLPTVDKKGQVGVFEVVLINQMMQTAIREDKLSQIASILKMGHRPGVVSFGDSIKKLLDEYVITKDIAKQAMDMLLEKTMDISAMHEKSLKQETEDEEFTS